MKPPLGLLGFPPLQVGRGKVGKVSADWLSGDESAGRFKGTGQRPLAGSEERLKWGGGAAGALNLADAKGSGISWAPPPRLRMCMGETDPYSPVPPPPKKKKEKPRWL